MKQPSKERGCDGKAGINKIDAIQWSERLKTKFGKDYGVYLCPHCGRHHLTTTLQNRDNYAPLLYVTKGEP